MANNKRSELATIDGEVSIVTPSGAMDFANKIKELVVGSKLYTVVQGKNYVNVEGWQVAGAFLGLEPIVEKVENLSDDATYRYRAEVSLYDKDGRKCGGGVAICTNKEPGKKNFEEYAVASMAQTRAVSKAFRVKLGWLLKIAGYETTPSEEMDAIVEAEIKTTGQKEAPRNKPWEKYQSNGKPTPKQIGLIKHLLKEGGATDENINLYMKKITTSAAASKAIEKLKTRLEEARDEEPAPNPTDEELENIDFAPPEETL